MDISLAIPNHAACSVIFDANGDGRPDIAVRAGNSVYLLVQSPGPVGTFANRGAIITLGTGVSVSAVAAADFNGDNKQDLLVATTPGLLGSVQLYLGNGDGTFQAPSTIKANEGLFALAIADFNNDHKPDFAVSSSAGVFVFIGDGTGAFPTSTVLSAASAGPPLAIGDFNHDGKPDIAYAQGVYLGNGDGTLGIPTGGAFYSRNSVLTHSSTLPSWPLATLITMGASTSHLSNFLTSWVYLRETAMAHFNLRSSRVCRSPTVSPFPTS